MYSIAECSLKIFKSILMFLVLFKMSQLLASAVKILLLVIKILPLVMKLKTLKIR